MRHASRRCSASTSTRSWRSARKSTGTPVGTPSATELTPGHDVASERSVDEVLAEAAAAGAHVLTPAHPTFWGGYAGYEADAWMAS